MSHAYNGLNDVCNISHLLFDNDDIEVYFKLYLLLYADDTVIFAETAEIYIFTLSTFGKYNYISFGCNFQVSQYKYIALRAD
jgi:hypothetical protein